MIDTGKMLESVERLERVFGSDTRATQSIGEVVELLTSLRQAEKDAARYRWLREQTGSDWEIDGEETSHIDVTMWRNDGFDNCNNGESLFGDSLDTAIDEAMQCNK